MISDDTEIKITHTFRYFKNYPILEPGQSIGEAIIEFNFSNTNPEDADCLSAWIAPYCNPNIPAPFICHVFNNDDLFECFYRIATRNNENRALAEKILTQACLRPTSLQTNINDYNIRITDANRAVLPHQLSEAVSFPMWIYDDKKRLAKLKRCDFTGTKEAINSAHLMQGATASKFRPWQNLDPAEKRNLGITPPPARKIPLPNVAVEAPVAHKEPQKAEAVLESPPAKKPHPKIKKVTQPNELKHTAHHDSSTSSSENTRLEVGSSFVDETAESAGMSASSDKKSKSSSSASRDGVFKRPPKRQKIEQPTQPKPKR